MKLFFKLLLFSIFIGLITFLGFLDSKKTFIHYKFEQFKTTTNFELKDIENSINDGYKLHSFIGFKNISHRILYSDPSLIKITISDVKGNLLYELSKNEINDINEIKLLKRDKFIDLFENRDYYIFKFRIISKKNTKGYITIYSYKKEFFSELYKTFYIIISIACLIIMVLGIYILFYNKKTSLSLLKPMMFLEVLYIFIVLIFTNYLLIQSIVHQNRAIADNLNLKLEHAYSLKIPFDRIGGIKEILEKDIKRYESLSYINITKNGEFLYHIKDDKSFDFSNEVNMSYPGYFIYFKTSLNTLYRKILVNLKDFIFLLFASGLLSYYLFHILLIEKKNRDNQNAILLIKPVIFLIFLSETLNLSFLPKYFENIALLNGISKSDIKYFFSIYFLFFTLSFIPATKIVKKFGTQKVFLIASSFAFLSNAVLVSSTDFYILMIGRVFGGISLGFTLVSAEYHLMANIDKSRRELISATTIILYNSAIICGSILGSLLNSYLESDRVFLIEQVISFVTILTILFFIKNYFINQKSSNILSIKDKIKIFFDRELISSIFSTGFFAKLTLSGVVIFSLPLLLQNSGISKASIGEILAFYSIGILVGGVFVKKIKNFMIFFKDYLGFGLLLSFFSLFIMGNLYRVDSLPILITILICSLFLLGISHSIISSFLLPKILEFDITKRVGITQVRPITLIYERGGNIFGPIVAMNLLVMYNSSFFAILIFSAISFLFMLLYKILFKSS